MARRFTLLFLLVALLGICACGTGHDEPPPVGRARAAATFPTITGFSPAMGTVGTVIAIQGSGFTGATQVLFSNAPGKDLATAAGVPAVFAVVSDTQIDATVPSGTAAGPIAVTTPLGTVFSPESFTTESSALPTISGFSPQSAGAYALVTVSGSGFTGTTSVTFNGAPAGYFYLAGDGTLHVSVPQGATTGPIGVTNTLGTATSASSFTVLPPPVITTVSPTSGKPGDSITLTGTGFAGVTSVCFGGDSASGIAHGGSSSATDAGTVDGGPVPPQPTSSGMCTAFTVQGDTQITVKVPSGAQSGYITVLGSGGAARSPTPFTVLSSVPPTIASFSPPSGGAGMPVDVLGAGFTGTTAVKFNGLAAQFFLLSDTELMAFVPISATSGPVSVTNTLGTATSASSFTVLPPPVITTVSPTSGKTGDSITLTGTGFTGVTGVCFGAGSTAIQPAPQPPSSGTGSPDAGSGAGDGGGLVKPPDSRGACGQFVVDGDTQITVQVPSGAQSGFITVFGPAGVAQSPTTFTVLSSVPPTIASFSPASGGVGMGVTIQGAGFTGTTAVKFNGLAAQFFLLSDTELVAIVPNAATSGPISVTNTLGTATSASSFTVLPPPVITGLSPTSGKAGDLVTLTGSSFTGATDVCFGGTGMTQPATGSGGDGGSSRPPDAKGSIACGVFTVDSDAQITVTVPTGGGSGVITVFGPGGAAQSPVPFTVLSSVPPTIASFSPASGGVGTPVSVLGGGFTGTTAVKFNGLAAQFFLQSDTELVAIVPNAATSGPISVTNTLGSATSAADFVVLGGSSPPSADAGSGGATSGTGGTGSVGGGGVSNAGGTSSAGGTNPGAGGSNGTGGTNSGSGDASAGGGSGGVANTDAGSNGGGTSGATSAGGASAASDSGAAGGTSGSTGGTPAALDSGAANGGAVTADSSAATGGTSGSTGGAPAALDSGAATGGASAASDSGAANGGASAASDSGAATGGASASNGGSSAAADSAAPSTGGASGSAGGTPGAAGSRATGGALTGSGGDATDGGPGPGQGAASKDDGSCGCHLAASSDRSSAPPILGLSLLLALARRRRRCATG